MKLKCMRNKKIMLLILLSLMSMLLDRTETAGSVDRGSCSHSEASDNTDQGYLCIFLGFHPLLI